MSKAGNVHNHEYDTVRPIALNAGCEFFDIAHMTEEFSRFAWRPFPPPIFANEYKHIFWDITHYVSLYWKYLFYDLTFLHI